MADSFVSVDSLQGAFFVLEGPDGVGKSSLTRAICTKFEEAGLSADALSLPGREPGTLGAHLYSLHHEPESHGVTFVSPASLQVLHVAAHIDLIERRLRPSLATGQTVILDRYWWSTWVYGRHAGIRDDVLEAIINLATRYWELVPPDIVFLLDRLPDPSSQAGTVEYERLKSLYLELAQRTVGVRVHQISNDRSLEEVAAEMWSIIQSALPATVSRTR